MRAATVFYLLVFLIPGSVLAQVRSAEANIEPGGGGIEIFDLPKADLLRATLEDEKLQLQDQAAHFAIAIPVNITPLDKEMKYDNWQPVSKDVVRWRLRLRSPGALSLSLAFGLFQMPAGGELLISSTDGSERIGPFTQDDNKAHGQLWTPPLLTDDLIIEVRVPAEIPDDFNLLLTRVNHGYAGFGESYPLSGSCQQDVVCFDSPVWHDVARSVALITIDGVRFCSGFMVNNTNLDGKPFFVTAHHCGVTEENAASVVVMWSYESSFCRDDPEELVEELTIRPSRNFQTGATLRATYEPTDVVLIELDDVPEKDWNVHYAGWDRSVEEPEGVTVIHHPNTDMKRLSYDRNLAKATFFSEDQGTANGDHIRVGFWEVGTTEGGSSGSPLFNEDQRVIGQLHGGYAQCGEKEADWFGRFAVSWSGNGKPGGRLRDWLDPLGTDNEVLNGLDASDLLSTIEP